MGAYYRFGKKRIVKSSLQSKFCRDFFIRTGIHPKKNGRIEREYIGGKTMYDITQIKEIIPHRYPFLLVDKIIELEEGKRAVGIKNVSANEEFFNGHFPDYPVMPGVLIVEALAQVGAAAILIKEENRGRIAFFAGIDNCRFKRQVKPGDQLRLEVEMVRVRGSIGKGKAVATVDGEIACETEITFALGAKKEE
jgi:3-hydroxyacyl-[acyl-carrier-protein] dehydratase